MSSPNYHTLDIEDAFTSNFSDYIMASPDYVLASPRKTFLESSNDSFGFVPIALPTLSPFHDDYMKVMHAYYAKESPIPPPVIVPPSPMLLPMFNPQEFFLLEELLPPKKRGQSSFPVRLIISTPLDYPFDEPIFTKFDIIIPMPPKRTSTSAEPTMTQDTIRQLVANSVAAALEAQAATMANTDNLNRNTRPRKTPVAKRGNYKEIISCQPFYFNSTEGVVGLIRWFERTELVFSRSNCAEENKVTYANGTVTASKPQTLEEAINISQRLMDKIIECGSMQGTTNHKRRFDDRRSSNNNNNYPNNRFNNYQNHHNNNSSRNNDYRQQQNRMLETFRSYAATLTENSGYTGNHPLCKKCTLHHTGRCTVKCNACNKVGDVTRNFKNKGPVPRSNQQPVLKLCEALILALPEGNDDFVVYCDASHQAQTEAIKEENIKAKNLRGMDKTFEIRPDGTCCIKYRSWLPLFEAIWLTSTTRDSYVEVGKNNDGFVSKRPKTSNGHDTRFWLSLQDALGTQLDMSTAYHPETDGKSERTIQTHEDMLRACVIYFGKGWEKHLPLKIVQIRQRLQAARDRLRSYGKLRGKPLEFQVRDRVMLKVSPYKGVIRFEKQRKLNPQYIGPFITLERIGPVAYKLELPKELSNIHNTFYISNLKKCLSNESLVIPMKELRLDDKLNFVEEPVEIMDREVVTDIIKRDKIQAKPNKTEHKTESVEKSKINQSQP
uniref:Putative reverse transcriptase domain-containing protein n=1 Tax=Tanacetum cinerariifolium TaxID=118510 RepID=A0A6L2JG23_TANCI|nr:putative reverse transcriptase domain-containing protein [Tanacetum cinerariifolium]